MTMQEIIERMHQGYALRNHGYGWHLYPPGKPTGQVLAVTTYLVDTMTEAGLISVNIPYTSAVAELTEKGANS